MTETLVGKKGFQNEVIRVRGEDIKVKRGFVNHNDLSFYPENPRIYSLVAQDVENPSQTEIFSQLEKMDHVQQLVKSIKLNGGLIEPIIVRDGEGYVLEGNSRLAAYRILSKTEPIEWAEIECKILPTNVSDSAIFSLLGEYHIIGKKDWAPFEQAGYLYRRKFKHGLELDDLEREVGLKKREIGHLISVYQYMIDVHEPDINKWSYYDSFIRSRKLKTAIEKFDGLEGKIVRMIKNNEFPRAADLRDKMPVIAEAGGKIVQKLITNQIDFGEALERASERTDSGGAVKRLRNFREWVCDVDVADGIASMPKEARSDCKYELNRIQRRIKALQQIAEKG